VEISKHAYSSVIFLYDKAVSILEGSMPSVKVLLFATFREKYGVKEASLEFDGTLKGFLDALGKKISPKLVEDIYDATSEQIKNTLILMINGRNVKDMKEEIRFQDKDVVAIFPPVAGG